jgi:hypothetical protein
MNLRVELAVQAGGVQRDLARVLVDVEHAALGAGVGRRLQVENGCLYAVDVQHPGQGEAAEAAADDRDRVVRRSGHGVLPGVRSGGWINCRCPSLRCG